MTAVCSETINALKEMNELWAARLLELNGQAEELAELEISNFFKGKTKEERVQLKKITEANPMLKQAQLQFLKLQKVIS